MNLTVLLQQVLKLFYSQSIMQKIEIIQEYETDIPYIYCDGNQIE